MFYRNGFLLCKLLRDLVIKLNEKVKMIVLRGLNFFDCFYVILL